MVPNGMQINLMGLLKQYFLQADSIKVLKEYWKKIKTEMKRWPDKQMTSCCESVLAHWPVVPMLYLVTGCVPLMSLAGSAAPTPSVTRVHGTALQSRSQLADAQSYNEQQCLLLYLHTTMTMHSVISAWWRCSWVLNLQSRNYNFNSRLLGCPVTTPVRHTHTRTHTQTHTVPPLPSNIWYWPNWSHVLRLGK